jgi:transmembrane sensor
MNKEEIKGLAKRFLEGTSTPEEREKLHNWSALKDDHEAEVVFTSEPEQIDEVKSRLFNQIQNEINKVSSAIYQKRGKTKLWYRITAAAAVLLVAGASVYFYTIGGINFFRNDLADAKKIAVGKNTAVLTLANGRQIDLSVALNGQLAEESGIRINKTSDGQLVYEMKNAPGTAANEGHLNTISTPKGGQYKVILPDGSKVWLNAASSLSFPSAFANLSDRKVRLKGEAYFEVAKDKAHPFVVQSEQQEVEVLGTHFNVNAYNEERRTKTTLLEGSVKIALREGSDTDQNVGIAAILKPGQQSVLTDGPISIKWADTEEAVAWKNGYFKFNSESLPSIMRQLSRWYDVEIVYEGEISKDHFGGTISRYKNVADVLEMLESTKLVKFKVEGRKIIVR